MTTQRRDPGRAGEHVRAFLAILVPGDIVAAAAGIQEQMRRTWPGAPVRWVREENMHLTVRFFGELDRDRLRRAGELVRRTEVERIEVRMARCSAFPAEGRPSVLWVGLEDSGGRLLRFVQRVDAALVADGFGPADKPWQSHLTLGRVPRDRRLRAEPEEFRAFRLPVETYALDTLALVRSDLRPEGPVYTPLETVRARV